MLALALRFFPTSAARQALAPQLILPSFPAPYPVLPGPCSHSIPVAHLLSLQVEDQASCSLVSVSQPGRVLGPRGGSLALEGVLK